jgi:hypothetical protein
VRPKPAKDRALCLQDRAFELVARQGVEQIPSHGVACAYAVRRSKSDTPIPKCPSTTNITISISGQAQKSATAGSAQRSFPSCD